MSIKALHAAIKAANAQPDHAVSEEAKAFRVPPQSGEKDDKGAAKPEWSPQAAEEACAAAGQSSYRNSFFANHNRYPKTVDGWPADMVDGKHVSLRDGQPIPRSAVR